MRERDLRSRYLLTEDAATDFAQRQQRERKRRSLLEVAEVVGIGTAIAATILISSSYFNSDFEPRPETNRTWGRPWEGQVQTKLLETDGFGGIDEIEVRKLSEQSAGDVIGYTRPGCLVETMVVYGPVYRVDGGDEPKLPLVKVGEDRFRPWFFVQGIPVVDAEGKRAIADGFIRGTNLKAPGSDAKTCK